MKGNSQSLIQDGEGFTVTGWGLVVEGVVTQLIREGVAGRGAARMEVVRKMERIRKKNDNRLC